MNLSLKLEPLHNSYVEILHCFNKGKPLSPSQLNFMRRYHAKLSDPTFDRILEYYKVLENKPTVISQNLTRPFLGNLRKKITRDLKNTDEVSIKLSSKQFFQFKSFLTNELIYFHGNQLLTGAPYFPGGVPHVDFVQWGNLFGIVKYGELLGERAQDGNILIHFKKMGDLKFEQCIEKYLHPQSQVESHLQQGLPSQRKLPLKEELHPPQNLPLPLKQPHQKLITPSRHS